MLTIGSEMAARVSGSKVMATSSSALTSPVLKSRAMSPIPPHAVVGQLDGAQSADA
jgi:hypothetical protein